MSAFSHLSCPPAVPRRCLSTTLPSWGTSINRRLRSDYLDGKQYRKEYAKRKRLMSNRYLDFSPLRKGVVQRCFVQKPKKPNSALRKVARIRLTTGKTVIAHIPGEGHNLQDHAVVLVRHGNYRDLGHVRHKVIRGALDCAGVVGRMSARSKYGAKRPKRVLAA